MPRKSLNQAQVDRFKEAARSLGCDEDEAAFDEKLKGIARQKLKNEPPDEEKPYEAVTATKAGEATFALLPGSQLAPN